MPAGGHASNIGAHEVAFLVRAYLQEHGFSGTLRSFEQEAAALLQQLRPVSIEPKPLRELLGEYLSLKAVDQERRFVLAQVRWGKEGREGGRERDQWGWEGKGEVGSCPGRRTLQG
jgi:hypothetical protein